MCKRIIIYIDSLNASGGIERIVYNLINAWKDSHEIILVTKDLGKCYYGCLEGIECISIDCPKKLNMNNRISRVLETFINLIKSVWSLKKCINNYISSNTVIYTVTPLNVLELYLSGINTNIIVASEHGSAFGINKIYKIIKKFIYPKIAKISVPNKMDTEYYLNLGYNAVYIPHIINKKTNNINDLQDHIILNVGRLTQDKRQDVLIKAWKENDEKNDWILLIVGEGEKKKELETMISDLELSDSVKILPARKEIEEVYKQASFFAFSSRYEGFGLVLLEAMSYGIPCLSFDCPSGPRDLIKNGINGFLVENDNVYEFSNALKKITTGSYSTRLQMGNEAYKVVEKWDNQRILEEWENVFNEI